MRYKVDLRVRMRKRKCVWQRWDECMCGRKNMKEVSLGG